MASYSTGHCDVNHKSGLRNWAQERSSGEYVFFFNNSEISTYIEKPTKYQSSGFEYRNKLGLTVSSISFKGIETFQGQKITQDKSTKPAQIFELYQVFIHNFFSQTAPIFPIYNYLQKQSTYFGVKALKHFGLKNSTQQNSRSLYFFYS